MLKGISQLYIKTFKIYLAKKVSFQEKSANYTESHFFCTCKKDIVDFVKLYAGA